MRKLERQIQRQRVVTGEKEIQEKREMKNGTIEVERKERGKAKGIAWKGLE